MVEGVVTLVAEGNPTAPGEDLGALGVEAFSSFPSTSLPDAKIPSATLSMSPGTSQVVSPMTKLRLVLLPPTPPSVPLLHSPSAVRRLEAGALRA